MKKILLLTILCFPVLFSWAQRKPEPKPVTAPAVRKPSGPSPYVLKKEYDSVSTSLRNQIKSLQGTIGSLKGSIRDKDNELSALALQMKQVEDGFSFVYSHRADGAEGYSQAENQFFGLHGTIRQVCCFESTAHMGWAD